MDRGLAVYALIGAACGALPLLLGFQRDQRALGALGFVACVAAGFLLGILGGGTAAAIFSILIVRSTRRSAADAPSE